MTVKRIVANTAAADLAAADGFYGRIFGLHLAMDHGWIVTYAGVGAMVPQLSIATEGGSGAPVPELSIEVDDVDEILGRVVAAGLPVAYGPVDEPWGVRRFFVRDPFGRLVNVLAHR